MQLIFLDFETYFTDTYSLRLMTPVEYILDHSFRVNGCAVAEGNETPRFLNANYFRDYILSKDPTQCAVVTHNAMFDMSILAWRYNFIPAQMIDTMGMSSALLRHATKSVSLDAIQKYLGLGEKGDVLSQVKGMTDYMIRNAGLWEKYAAYAIDDCVKMREIFKILIVDFPKSELLVMDSVIRACVSPKFQLDEYVLAQHKHTIEQQKHTLMGRIGAVSKKDLMSNDKFADALRTFGIDPPMKKSLVTGQQAYAFAKTDEAMAELAEHPDPNVQALVAARTGMKSTLEETRTTRFIRISRLQWPGHIQHRMPIPLNYAAAHTHRLGGAWKLNLQNLGRNSLLRKALIAPMGYKVISSDASQIEARLTAWFCGQEDLRKAFEDGDDIYIRFAESAIYRKPLNKKDNPMERFVGKQTILGCGYSMGPPKFQRTVKTVSRLQLGVELDLGEEQSREIVSAYRTKYSKISGMWKAINETGINILKNGGEYELGPVEFSQNKIRLPNGLYLYYDDVQHTEKGVTYTYAGVTRFLHGGKCLENIIQALARIIIMDVGSRMRNNYGLHWALTCHDELVYVEPEEYAEQVARQLNWEMCVRPSWGKDIPLSAEGGIGNNYGEVK